MRLSEYVSRIRPAWHRARVPVRLLGGLPAGLLAAALVAGCSGPREFTGFRTTDGITIVGDLHLPAGEGAAPLVLLGHQLGRDRRSWDPLVPVLLEAGYAVAAVDHRGFGESRREVSSPGELTETEKARLHLDLLEAIDSLAGHPRVDLSRVAVVASGLSVNGAVRCAIERPSVRSLVLLAGYIHPEEEAYLLDHPELPVLLIAAVGDKKGTSLMRQHAGRLTGDRQRYVEFEPIDRSDPCDWVGTDGLQRDTGLAALIAWFLRGNFVPGDERRGRGGESFPSGGAPGRR